MHEMSIAINVINIACKEAQKDGAESISVIEMEVGSLSGVMIDSLTFCYEAACKDTMAEDSALKIIPIPATAKCLKCKHEFEIESFMALCPECESYEIDILRGRELRLKAISVN